MAFRPKFEIPTHTLRRATIANAVGAGTYTVAVGMAIQPGATGHVKYVTQATATSPILGVVVGLEFNGKITEVNKIVGVNAALGTSSASAAVYNDNETNAQPWRVIYIPSLVDIDYSADVSAALDTTTDSGGNVYLNLISATTGVTGGATLDEASVAVFSGTQGQFFSYGADKDQPANTKVVVGHWSKTL